MKNPPAGGATSRQNMDGTDESDPVSPNSYVALYSFPSVNFLVCSFDIEAADTMT